MPRASTSSDAFSAIAEPRRRQILSTLAASDGDRDVSALVEALGWPQPQVSKHLGVLRSAGLVTVARRGKRRVYSINGDQLKTVYDWAKSYERFWDHQLARIKARAEVTQRQLNLGGSSNPSKARP